MPKVSVCLPIYNGKSFVRAAIESVLAQSFGDFELLVADDGSTDGSVEVVQEFAVRDSRVVFWRNESNLGLFENYNACLHKAQGQYLKPFAQDDLLAPNCLKRLVEALDENPDVQLVSSGRRWISDTGKELKVIRPFPSTCKVSGRDVIRYNLIQLTNWVGEPSTVMFRAERLLHGFDPSLYHYGDIDYWFRIVENGQYLYLDELLCDFRRHTASTTSKNLSGMFFALDILRLGKKYDAYLQEIGETEEHFLKRALEVAALNVDHLVRNEELNVGGAVRARSGREKTLAGAQAELDAFKELTFDALRYITRLLAAYDDLRCRTDDERQHLERQLQDMRDSTSWKLTAPLRQLTRGREG